MPKQRFNEVWRKPCTSYS